MSEVRALHVVDESDEELLGRIAGRDPLAFETLYRRYARAVFGFAVRRLRDQSRAEDAVQETFAAVWRSSPGFDPARGRPDSWLFAIARNVIINSIRISSRSRLDPVDEVPELVSPGPAPDESAEEEWVAFCVHAAVAELPERERVPLELAYWHSRSQSEIANMLGLPLGTIKTRMRRGLARMAMRLEGTA